MRKLNQIEGIDVKHSKLLERIGIEFQEDFLTLFADRKSREKVASQTGIYLVSPEIFFYSMDLRKTHNTGWIS